MSAYDSQSSPFWDGHKKACTDIADMLNLICKRAPGMCPLAISTEAHIHTPPFNSLLSGTTRVSQYQKGTTNLDFTEARGSEWQWHHLGHMQVCTSLQTDNHASTPPHSFFTGRMPFLPPNQQCQSTEGDSTEPT